MYKGGLSIAEWDDDYARLAHAASQLRTTGLNQTNFPSGSRESQIISVRSGLEGLLARLRQLERSQALPPAEFIRRKHLIEHLSQQVGGGRMSPSLGGATQQSQQQPQQWQQPQFQSVTAMALKQQDEMIDELALGVGRLKHQTHKVNDEARLHVNLLDDMDADVEKAQASMEAETRRAQKLQEDKSVWKLYMIIIGLSVLLLLLILLGLS